MSSMLMGSSRHPGVRRLSCAILGACLLLSAGVGPVFAQLCGDPEGSGTVTVSDAVQVLRAAAGLSSACTTAICDLNLDGSITPTDAVLALRLAAKLLTVATCLPAQAEANTLGTLVVGIGIIPSTSAAVSAATAGTNPCADGGTRISTANGFTDVNCQAGDLLSNGTVSIAAQAGNPDEMVTFDSYSIHRFSTGETLVSSGTLVFTVNGSTVRVNGGPITRMSTLLGSFSDAFMDVEAEGTASPVALNSGTVVTTVTQGRGAFGSLATLATQILGVGVSTVIVTPQDQPPQTTSFVDNIVDNGDGTVTDNRTGLQWEKKDNLDGTVNPADLHDADNRYTWAGCCSNGGCMPDNFCQPNAAAAATCAAEAGGGAQGCSVCASGTCNVAPFNQGALTTVWDWVNQLNAATFAGHSDWRLPSEAGCNSCFTNGNVPVNKCPCSPNELETMVDPIQGSCGEGSGPCIDPIFGPTDGEYWSGTPDASRPGQAWFLLFQDDNAFTLPEPNSNSVRAVRGGS